MSLSLKSLQPYIVVRFPHQSSLLRFSTSFFCLSPYLKEQQYFRISFDKVNYYFADKKYIQLFHLIKLMRTTTKFKFFLILSQITVGALLTIIYKSQNSIYVYQGAYYKQNFHPYIQTLTMFIGQLLCLPIYFIVKKRYPQQYADRLRRAKQQGKKLSMNKLYLMIPAMCDLVTSTLHFIALNYVSSSAYQMVNGGNIVICFLFSVFFLRQPFVKSQLVGSLLVIVGIIFVALANIIFSQSSQLSSSVSMEVFGYSLLIISLFTSGLFYTVEQKLMSIYHIQALEIVGYEGFFGFITYIILTFILSFIPFNYGLDACVFVEPGEPYMQAWSPYFSQIIQNKVLLILTFCWILNVTAYNPLGVTITKHINALARAISDVCQTGIVWIIGIAVTLSLGSTYPNLCWEKLQAQVIIFQLIGFVFLIFGNLIYNQIIRFKFLDRKENLEKLSVQQTQQSQYQTLEQENK